MSPGYADPDVVYRDFRQRFVGLRGGHLGWLLNLENPNTSNFPGVLPSRKRISNPSATSFVSTSLLQALPSPTGGGSSPSNTVLMWVGEPKSSESRVLSSGLIETNNEQLVVVMSCRPTEYVAMRIK